MGRQTRLGSRLIIFVVMLLGFSLTIWLSEKNRSDEQKDWQAKAQLEAQERTRLIGDGLEASFGPLAGLASVMGVIPNMTYAQFLATTSGLEERISIAFIENWGVFQEEADGWQVRQMTQVDRLSGIFSLQGPHAQMLQKTLQAAAAQPNVWVLSQPVTVDKNFSVYVALGLRGSPKQVAMAVIDLKPTLRRTIAARKMPGLHVRISLTGKDGDKTLLLDDQPTAPVLMRFNTAQTVADKELLLEWSISEQFATPTPYWWIILGAGAGLTLLLVIVLWRQMSEQVRVEGMVKAKEEEIGLLLHSTLEGIVGLDAQGQVLFINQAALRMLDMDSSQVPIGYAGADLFIPPEAQALNAPQGPVQPLFSEWLDQLRRGQTVSLNEQLLVRKNGSDFPATIMASPFQTNEVGRFRGAVLVFSDATERQRVRQTLQNEYLRLQSILDGAPVGCLITVNGRLRFANQSLLSMLNLQLDDPVSKVYVDQSDQQQIRDSVLSQGCINSMGMRLYGAQNQILDTLVSVNPFRFDGEDGFLSWVVDITALRNVERAMTEARARAEEATVAKSNFLANMSHEIRTPMNAIIGMSDLALRLPLETKARNYIEKVHRAADNLLGIINDILDFSKIEAGKMEVERTEFLLDDLLDNLASLLGFKAQDKGLELQFDFPCDLSLSVLGDALRLGQVLVNLGNNAIKFTEHGQVVMGMKVIEQSAAHIRLHFWVQDSGIGMTPEQQSRLFQSFSQADASTTRKYGGTGLGLAISKHLVEIMQGRIWLESEVGVGSCFHFEVGFGLGDGAVTKRVLHAEVLTGLRALVVDDNASAREILTHQLERLNLKVQTAADGLNALALLNTSTFDLVLLDWRMPRMDGLECAAEISRRMGEHAPPVILVTAYGGLEVLQNAAPNSSTTPAALAAVLTKPVSPALLLEAIGKALNKTDLVERRTAQLQQEYQSICQQLVGTRLLLVEDNDMNQELALELLGSAGIQVVLAQHGQHALDILAQDTAFDGILMDCQMPIMDGYTATRILRQDPSFSDLPIIAMTANAMLGDREKAIAAGMNDHIAKPLNVATMFATIARWVKPLQVGAAVAERFVTPVALSAAAPLNDEALARLARLPGVDVQEGLSHCNQNSALYVRLFDKFVQTQRDFGAQFDAARTQGDDELAQRLAHTLKGVAGNLGLAEVQSAAALLEHACVDAARVEVWAGLSAQVCTALEQLIQAYESTSPLPTPAMAGTGPTLVDTEHLDHLLHHLHALVETGDASAVDVAEDIMQLTHNSRWERSSAGVQKAISDFDFERADTLLQALLVALEQEVAKTP